MARRIPRPVEYAALAIGVVLIVLAVVRDVTKPSGLDYCAAINLRSCTVTQRGTFVVVTSGTHAYLLFMDGVKVLSTQQIQ